jgi:uncharacterized protein involved in exopolysaccharide biosynthesis
MERTYTVDELLSALRRRWVRAVAVAATVLAVAALLIARQPNEYRAKALVMVEPSTPHPDLVVPVISTTLAERVKSVRAQVFARGLLAPVVEELKLYLEDREKGGMEAAVDSLRKDLEVNGEGDDAFSIAVKARDPETAARTANRLAELYIEGNLAVRQGQVQRTRDVISHELDQLRAQLAASETKVAAFKKAHRDELPELVESRMRERDQIAKQIELEHGFLQTALTRVDLLGTQPAGKDTEVGRLEEQLDTVRGHFGAAAASLTSDHPDVQRFGRQVSDLHARLEKAKARAAANDLEQRRMNAAIERGRASIKRLEERMAGVDKLIVTTPQVAAQLAEVSRSSEELRAKVTHLVSKKAEADIAAQLEAKNAPNEFRVLEAAVPPALPASPNRPQALALALVAALLLGGAVVMGQEISDRSLRTAGEANQWLALPVLATVPRIPSHTRNGRVLALPAGRRVET